MSGRSQPFEGPSTKSIRVELLTAEDQQHLLSDEQFAAIQPLLPPYPRPKGQPGYPRSNPRVIIEAVLWRSRNGAKWRSLPIAFGSHKTVFDVFNKWSKSGLWTRIYECLLVLHAAAGLIDADLVCADGTIARAHKAAAGARHAVGADGAADKKSAA